MTHDIDLKTMERKAYLSYHKDGLLDVGLGLLILAVGIGRAVGMPWLLGVFFAVGIPSYGAAKKILTIPRLGLVHFGPDRQRRVKREISFFLIYFTITAMLGVVMLSLVTAVNRSPEGFGRLLEKFHMAPPGILVAIAFAALAYWKQINRYYIYAAFLLVAVFAGPLLAISHSVYITAAGAVILIAGLAILIHFLLEYPLPEKESPGNA